MNNLRMNEFRSFLRQMERFLVNSLKSDGECCGITFNECHILMEISDKKEVVMKDLAGILLMDKSIISRSIDLMVRNGLLLRKEAADDRRKKIIVLTSEGEEKAGEINSFMNLKYEKLFSNFTADEGEIIVKAAKLLSETFDKWKEVDPGCCKGDKNGCCS